MHESTAAGVVKCHYCELDRIELPVASSDAGFAVPSYGALVDGWTIVFPRTHVLSLAELNAAEWDEYSRLIAFVRERIERTYGPAVLFEHGSAGSGRPAACGVDHAHMHVVPLRLGLVDSVGSLLSLPPDAWQPVAERVAAQAGMDYVFIEDATGRWVTYQQWLPSQVVRQAIASRLGIIEWDWKLARNLDRVEATRAALRAAA